MKGKKGDKCHVAGSKLRINKRHSDGLSSFRWRSCFGLRRLRLGSQALVLRGGVLLGVYLLFSIKVARQWEKVAVLRLGRYIGLRGPGVVS